MIGYRLKLARSAAALSLRALEEQLGGMVTAQAIGKYERDEMMPSSSVLIALARALEVSEDYLLNAGDVELVGVEFRKHKLTRPKDDATVRARILSEVERYIEVERILRLDGRGPALPAARPVRSFVEVEAAAGELRKQWKLGDDAIPNLCELLEEKGVKVCSIALPEKISGVQASIRTTGGEQLPVIVVNSEQAGERQRFTMAHELGHLYLAIKGSLGAEDACQRFAGAFLVPSPILKREIGASRRQVTLRELFELKRVFGVSAQALAYRCKDLEIISQSAYTGLFKQFSVRGWRKEEPVPVPVERPARFERLCLRALAEGLISESKASELLKKTVREVVMSMSEPPDPVDGRSGV